MMKISKINRLFQKVGQDGNR